MLIINADDWGRSEAETDAALSCYRQGRITSVSAMVFMRDSERAARLANETDLDVGLHLNLSQAFTADDCGARLSRYQGSIRRFLTTSKYALCFYNPLLRRQFSYVYQAQIGEFLRLYGRQPSHVDGHQHMHLCANVLLDKVIPKGQKLRRNFSFWPGERMLLNRTYRRFIDQLLSSRYQLTDFFFSLSQCLRHNKLSRALELARTTNVEIMTHPLYGEEDTYLMSDGCREVLRNQPTGTYAML